VIVVDGLRDEITDVPGIRVGSAQDVERMTGCTVILCEAGAVVGVEVRGAAPATRETDLCRPGTLVERANAIFLTGGSAFGLDAAAGVMRFLRERGSGYQTAAGVVPIVPAAAIFDLGVGEVAWPDPEMAYAACTDATGGRVAQGPVGAGVGATVGKALGPENAARSGLGSASVHAGDFCVGALMVVNAVGNVVSPVDGRVLAGARDPQSGEFFDPLGAIEECSSDRTNTTIGVVVTDAPLTSEQVNHLAMVAQDALVRVIRPAHTLFDGDAIFALSTGSGSLDWLRTASTLDGAVSEVIVKAVLRAVSCEQ
jgi:L-aminopeptidase/D-esterase-like protein